MGKYGLNNRLYDHNRAHSHTRSYGEWDGSINICSNDVKYGKYGKLDIPPFCK